jgi:hypothetical protein
MFNRLTDLYDMSDEQVNKLKNLIGLMRIKCNVEEINEGESAIDKTFHKYTQMTGVPEIQQLRFNESEGVSKDMTPEDLAKKHGVDLEDIKKEINLGTKIELEHTEDEERKELQWITYLNFLITILILCLVLLQLKNLRVEKEKQLESQKMIWINYIKMVVLLLMV